MSLTKDLALDYARLRVLPLICLSAIVLFLLKSPSFAQSQGITSLSDSSVKFEVPAEHFVTLKRGGITAIIVDNHAIDIPELPEHRAGYNGVAKLSHVNREENLFVPGIAGLNFEHIHDGTAKGLVEKFEPRKFPMELRVVDDRIVELYQPPTGNWQLESCGRYELLEDGTIEYTFECIPRAVDFKHNFIGLFWASYIHQPEEMAIFFKGKAVGTSDAVSWIKGVTPKHGVASTHRPPNSESPPIDEDFPLTLVNHPSKYEYAQSWYYGVSHGMAMVQMFRAQDQIWLAQSPSGGGTGNPAWDFQWFVRNPEKDKTYRFVMRATYLPYESQSQIEAAVSKHLEALSSVKADD